LAPFGKGDVVEAVSHHIVQLLIPSPPLNSIQHYCL